MTKAETRTKTKLDVSEFLARGGSVTICRSCKRKIRRPASGSQPQTFAQKDPPSRIVSSWGLLNGRF